MSHDHRDLRTPEPTAWPDYRRCPKVIRSGKTRLELVDWRRGIDQINTSKWFCAAISWARKCFLPSLGISAAFTVASLAIIMHSRPATRPIPAITPALAIRPSYMSYARIGRFREKAKADRSARNAFTRKHFPARQMSRRASSPRHCKISAWFHATAAPVQPLSHGCRRIRANADQPKFQEWTLNRRLTLHKGGVTNTHALSSNSSRPISIRRISLVPAPIS